MQTIQYSTISDASKTTVYKTGRYLGYLIVLLTFILLGYIMRQEFNANAVYSTCMAGHYDTTADLEQRCGDIQDKYGYEFLCNDTTGLDPYVYSQCWVEKV